jgi:FlaA1/EpsC-like NDP-sugar epimerase
MRRKIIFSLLLLGDAIVVSVVPFLALLIRFDGDVSPFYYKQLMMYVPTIIGIQLLIFYWFNLYNRLWRYAGVNEILNIMAAVTVSSATLFGYIVLSPNYVYLPRSLHLLSWMMTIFFIGGSRLAVRFLYYYMLRQSKREARVQNVLIVGAGDAGAILAREINQRYFKEKKVVGFIDDEPSKINQYFLGTKVLGRRCEIPDIVEEHQVDEIIIAMPSADSEVIKETVWQCKMANCSAKIVPGIYQMIDGQESVQQLREVDLEDLLRRDPVKLDLENISSYLTGKRVLVTGAGGSIGSELCRQIARMSPSMLLLLGKGENSIYEIDNELKDKFGHITTEPIIADVRDAARLQDIFAIYRPEVVFHAAAHKHVPLMEAHPIEAVRNNIFGTKNVAEAADRFDVKNFVMISTDKAVNPTSVMGTTKRVAELIIQNLSRKSATKFVAVRFGNVLGSRGSVIPLFKRQIAKGGPITVTHPDMQRYFMTIPEASQLVLQAGSMANGGEVFVLDMGKPVKIVDMACDLIELSGLVPYKEIDIKFTGLRPGEKMFEELLTAEEGSKATRHEKIFVASIKMADEKKLFDSLKRLQTITDKDRIIREISYLVPSYSGPNKEDEKEAKVAELLDKRFAATMT